MTQQTATLKELVLAAVEGFLVTDSSFSVFDVTQSIRQVVNSGAVNIPALFVNNRSYKYEVGHDDVKYFFNELRDAGTFSQDLNGQFNGTYVVYSGVPRASQGKTQNFANSNPMQSMSNAMNALSQALGNMRNGSVLKVPSAANNVAAVATSNKLGRSEMIARVRTYLDNCNARGFTPTNKQIQSAIKRGSQSTGWSRQELDQVRVGINNGTI